MIKKIDLGPVHHEVFGNPAPLGLLGLAVACASLVPIAFGYSLTPQGFISAGIFAILFGGFCQLLAGLMDFANGNAYGGTIFTAFAFNWFLTGAGFIAAARGYVIDHNVQLAVEIVLLVVFLVLTYGFGFFSKLLFFFLLDIDLLYVFRIARTFTGPISAVNLPIAFLTVGLGLIGLWLALAGLVNPVAGRPVFPVPGPMYLPHLRQKFDWSLRREIFSLLYQFWRENAFREMPFSSLESGLGETHQGVAVIPDLFYLAEYGAVHLTHPPEDPHLISSARLTAKGIDLFEQLVLRKYEF